MFGVRARARRGRPPTFLVPALALACPLAVLALALSSCAIYEIIKPDEPLEEFVITGRLAEILDCRVLQTPHGNYLPGRISSPPPEIGSLVSLRVREVRESGYGWCPGKPVDILDVILVAKDFRADPVTVAETWGPGAGPMMIGDVTIADGATLTLLPGTDVHLVPGGVLRVQGRLIAEGTPGDSVRIVSWLGWGGDLEFDETSADSKIRAARLGSIRMRGACPAMDGVAVGHFTVERGALSARGVRCGYLEARETTLDLQECDIEYLTASTCSVRVVSSEGSRYLAAHESRVSVEGTLFRGWHTSLHFDESTSASFTHNTFAAAATWIGIPQEGAALVFTKNNFTGTTVSVGCDCRRRIECLDMRRNWWGRVEEERVRALLQSSPVCYEPWLLQPDPLAPPEFGGAP